MGGFVSRNAAFEADWASQTEISLVTEYYKENDRPVVKTIDVPLPWAWKDAPRQWLPRYTALDQHYASSNRTWDGWHYYYCLHDDECDWIGPINDTDFYECWIYWFVPDGNSIRFW